MSFWIPLMILLVLCSIFFTYVWQQYRRRRELEMLSKSIERVLRGRNEENPEEGNLEEKKAEEEPADVKKKRRVPREDVFLRRVYYKLNRLEQVTAKGYEQIAAERDSMRVSIEELAHQMRTPLTNLEINLDFLAGSDLPGAEQLRYLRAARASEQKLSSLAENFIKMSSLESRMVRVTRQEWDLLETLETEAGRLQPEMEEKRLVLKKDFPGKLHFRHDKELFGEAVFCLLDNAVKYSGRGGTIEFGARQNEMFTQIWLRDHGIGIEEGDEEKIFRRFYRAENAREQEGVGIGLTIAREIVLQHDGFMRVVRQKDGTRMEIHLENQ